MRQADKRSDNPELVQLSQELENVLKLRTPPFGIKMLETVEAMQAIPKLRRPTAIHTTDQIIAQAARLGWTVGITADDLVGDQCRAVIGLARQDETWLAGEPMAGVWYATREDAAAHQAAMHCVPHGRYQAMVVSPLRSNRLTPPDIVLFYATPGAMIYFINGLQWSGFRRFDWSVVGESACADSWGRALATGQPSLSLPCFAERRYGGVLDDEMLMAITPADLKKALDGMRALSGNGLRYPFAQYGIQQDVRAGLGVSYGETKAAPSS